MSGEIIGHCSLELELIGSPGFAGADQPPSFLRRQTWMSDPPRPLISDYLISQPCCLISECYREIAAFSCLVASGFL